MYRMWLFVTRPLPVCESGRSSGTAGRGSAVLDRRCTQLVGRFSLGLAWRMTVSAAMPITVQHAGKASALVTAHIADDQHVHIVDKARRWFVNCKPFVWTADADLILGKVRYFREANF